MLSKGFLKPDISIDLIGRRRFWIGIIIGFSFALLISYFINYSREALRMLSFFRDPYILSRSDFRIYDLFFASFSASFGFGITIIIWLYGRKKFSRKRYRKLYAMTYTWFIVITSFIILARFGSFVSYLLYGNWGYTKHFDILKDYKIILILIPAFIYFSQWNAVRLILKLNKWILYILAIYILLSFYLFQTTQVDRSVLNSPYYYQNKERFDYIDNETDKIKRFGYEVTPNTKEILRKRYYEETYELVDKLKHSFSNNRVVPIDTLILEKIVIHNLNKHNHGYYRQRDRNWPYALPEEIYYQILKHKIDSHETQILFEILYEQISILEVNEVEWEQRKFFTRDERAYYYSRRSLIRSTETIQSRMIQVIDKLKSGRQYEKYYHLIPDIEMSEDIGRQKWYDIEL